MRRFRLLNLTDLKLGLDDLFTKRVGALRSSSFGTSYEPLLTSKLDELENLRVAASSRNQKSTDD
jgi:hypothetical protein